MIAVNNICFGGPHLIKGKGKELDQNFSFINGHVHESLWCNESKSWLHILVDLSLITHWVKLKERPKPVRVGFIAVLTPSEQIWISPTP